ncbi:hypothetical protein L7F22_007846 [Adiantum nelumboides]|nr:hypothetical protein [Adiantum nelumboides]
MVVTFAIDFHQSRGQYLSLEPLLAQEHEFTRILVARILQLRPNILVVKESVSRLALDMFQEAGVIVVWSLKESAVQAISRCCQADIIPSIDRLALEPRLGRCASFDVETFENQRARGPGTRKTYMRFSTAGNATSLGCSIVLRGASLEVLAKIKAIVLLLTYVAHNLRLEERLNRDEGTRSCVDPSSNTTRIIDDDGDAIFQDDDEEIKEALLPFKNAVLSSSAAVRITPPCPCQGQRKPSRCGQTGARSQGHALVGRRSRRSRSRAQKAFGATAKVRPRCGPSRCRSERVGGVSKPEFHIHDRLDKIATHWRPLLIAVVVRAKAVPGSQADGLSALRPR